MSLPDDGAHLAVLVCIAYLLVSMAGYLWRQVRPPRPVYAPLGAWHGSDARGKACACAFGHGHATRHAAKVCTLRRGGRAPRWVDAGEMGEVWKG